MNFVKIHADYLKTANYALFHNRVSICKAVELTNVSEQLIEDIRVTCTGELISQYETELIVGINPGDTVRISPFKLSPDPAKLAVITERIVTNFKLTVTSKGEPIGEETYEIELMPYDHWTGLSIMPQSLASFITPNHPSINNIVVKSAEILKEITGSSSFNGYATVDPNDVRKQVAAVFRAIHDLGIVYRPLAASYEIIGQRITLPEQVITSKTANCIELTLLMASVLEAVGLNSIIVIQGGHAYLGVWLVDACYPYSADNDPAYIEKKCSRGISEMLVIECTWAAQDNVSFEDAVRIAERNLADHSDFEMFIDVKRSRLENILPLPEKIDPSGAWAFASAGVEHNSCATDVEDQDRYDLNQLSNTNKKRKKFDIWERKLLDLSLRNTLLNLSLRRRAVQFISFDIRRIEEQLQDGKEYCITSRPETDPPLSKSETLIRSKLHEPLRELTIDDIEHSMLHTYLNELDTKIVLKNIYRTSRNAIEETGANSLFLVIGTLRWYESDKTNRPRYAPLLLLPVEMVYKKGKYYIRSHDEEITLNITLIEFLRQNYNIHINGLTPLPKDNKGIYLPLIFALFRDALKDLKRWDVEEECLLGIFSFSKFLMWHDIHTHRDELKHNDIINSLVANRLMWTPDTSGVSLKDIDMTVSPINTALPMPADSSQMTAVLEGGKGKSFILYGPPGTGKSQTITNLIANALYHGKRVLFVAEKMAALSVVQSRLAKIGLDTFCLELHSNKVTKRHVLKQLDKSIRAVRTAKPKAYKKQAEKLFSERKELIAYVDALHKPHPHDGLSLYDCIARYESISAQPMPGFRFDSVIDTLLATEGPKAVEDLLGSRFNIVLELAGQPSKHPLKGMNLDRAMFMDSDSMIKRMKSDIAALDDFRRGIDSFRGTKDLRAKLMRDNIPAILDEDPEALRSEWREIKAKWIVRRFFAKHDFIRRLRQFNQFITEHEIDPLIDDLIAYRNMHNRIEAINQIIKHHFEIEHGEDEVPDESCIEESAAKLAHWVSHADRMRDWLHWSEYCDVLRSKGLGCVVDTLDTSEQDLSIIKEAYLKALFKYKAEEKISHSDTLATFDGRLFDDKVASYRRMTEEYRLLTQRELYSRLAARITKITDHETTGSEISLLNRNICNGGRGRSLRDLFDQLPTLLPQLCPCMLMSPISVAQYIDLSAEKFDLVIFDEASQMPTSEAVGAIARGKSLIVVGDPKQMPPTSFFTSTNVEVEDVVMDDMESILEDCRSLEMPSLQLLWHYRSRHESLIAFSNNEYYEGSLITFPSVDDQSAKINFIPVSGIYDKGGKRCNREEAEAIVDEIVRRLKDTELRKSSIGVIAFSVMQQSLIEDILQDKLDKNMYIRHAAQEMYEPIFVKNLENVQGDERDVILFSIGYGPDKEGKVSMNFGPLNNPGGERRLNVAVSRARQEMYIFSSIKSTDIDMRRSKSLGLEGLKHFLHYAETHTLPNTAHRQAIHRPSPISEQIAAELRTAGYTVATNVGRSQFRVDVAIESKETPGTYTLGILLDAEGYRDTHTTRDREVVQPAILQSLNWKIMRVWSVDWFNNRERVISQIINSLCPPLAGWPRCSP